MGATRRLRVSATLFIGVLLGSFFAYPLPILSGSTTVNLSAIPLPCTLVGEIKLDTPCERTVFSWDLDMAIKLKLSFSPSELWLDAVGGFAGFEHVILGGSKTFAGVEVKPELWFAVPFESVTDSNGTANHSSG